MRTVNDCHLQYVATGINILTFGCKIDRGSLLRLLEMVAGVTRAIFHAPDTPAYCVYRSDVSYVYIAHFVL